MVSGRTPGAPADKPLAARAVLHYVYYWYNFMPLARGSAAVGYTTILSLFWATGSPISVNIPKDYQTDWEAILCRVRSPTRDRSTTRCALAHSSRRL